MKTYSRMLALGTMGFFLSSCTAFTPLKPGAENVVITTVQNLPQCKALGPIQVEDINGTTIGYTSHKALDHEAANVVRNAALKKGGNVVVITAHDTTYTDSGDTQVDTHEVKGEAYSCPADALPTPVKMPHYNKSE